METLLLGKSAILEDAIPVRRHLGVALRIGTRGGLRALLYYALVLLLIAMTIQRERFGIPIELDGPAVLLVALLAFLLTPGSFLRFWTLPLILPAAGFVVSGYVSCLANADPLGEIARFETPLMNACIRQAMILTYRVVQFYVVVVAVTMLPEMRRRPAVAMLSMLVIQTLLCLVLLVWFPGPESQLLMRGSAQFGVGSVAFMGFFLEPNLFGIYAAATIALWMPLVLTLEGRARSLTLACMLVGMLAVFMSYTRSSWLAVVGTLGLLSVGTLAGLRIGREPRWRGILLLSILVIVGFGLSGLISQVAIPNDNLEVLPNRGPSPVLERAGQILDFRSGSGQGRIQVWGLALEEWSGRPWFGLGLLSFQPSGIPSTDGWLYSSLVQTLHDTGLVGLLFMVWFCAAVALMTWRAYSASTFRMDKALALGYLAAQIVLFFVSQFSSFFWGALTWTLYGLSVGFGVLMASGEREGRGPRVTVP